MKNTESDGENMRLCDEMNKLCFCECSFEFQTKSVYLNRKAEVTDRNSIVFKRKTKKKLLTERNHLVELFKEIK